MYDGGGITDFAVGIMATTTTAVVTLLGGDATTKEGRGRMRCGHITKFNVGMFGLARCHGEGDGEGFGGGRRGIQHARDLTAISTRVREGILKVSFVGGERGKVVYECELDDFGGVAVAIVGIAVIIDVVVVVVIVVTVFDGFFISNGFLLDDFGGEPSPFRFRGAEPYVRPFLHCWTLCWTDF